jgi:2-polyprenyl-3-methyl-5-hydroxy-6-metoxy-1,4-benzoquinol methylase
MKSSTVSSGISRSAEHRTLVDTHFHSRVTQWRDVYEQEGLEGAIYRKRLDIVLRWIDELAIPPREKVLEIGCGAGRCTVALAQRGYLIHAMDSVEGMLNSTQKHASEAGVSSSVTTSLGDAHNLAFPDGSFGLVLAIGVIPYLNFPQKGLSEMVRVLRPGGFLVVTAGNRWRLNDVLDPWGCPLVQPARKLIGAIFRRFRKARTDDAGLPLRLDSLRRVDQWLSRIGLLKIKATTVGFPPIRLRGRPIFGEQRSLRLNNRLQELVDRDVPWIRSSGMDYIVLTKKQ